MRVACWFLCAAAATLLVLAVRRQKLPSSTLDEFICSHCGESTTVASVDEPTICERCCAKSELGHTFEYDYFERRWLCTRCGCIRDPYWYYED